MHAEPDQPSVSDPVARPRAWPIQVTSAAGIAMVGGAANNGGRLMTRTGERDKWITQDDASLLAACEVDTYRATGPGGQKRNKTSSAVRLRHGPTGLIAIGEESRSQHENKARALRRLRLVIAMEVRMPVDDAWVAPDALTKCRSRTGRLEISQRNPDYALVVAFVLDVLVALSGSLRDAAERLRASIRQVLFTVGVADLASQ